MMRLPPDLSDRPLPVRWAWRLSWAVASLELAVALIAVLVVVLAWATIVDSWYGASAAFFGFYGTWWFLGLCLLLGLNVLASMLVRLPWRRDHLGFLLTHLGILILLAGALVGNFLGVRTQLRVYEGNASRRAERTSEHIELRIQSKLTRPDDTAGPIETIKIPFRPGPFNWADYGELPWFPWRLAPRSQGPLYDRDGVRVEVLDYCADSRLLAVPRISLMVEADIESATGPTTGPMAEPVPIALSVAADDSPHGVDRPFGMGQQQALPGGGRVVFWMTGSRAETDAFLADLPEDPLGGLGQVVLCHDGRTYRFQVDQWQKEPRQPLGETGLEVELVQVSPIMLGVQIRVHGGDDDPPRPMTLLATLPHMNRQDDRDGLFGSYWLDPATATLGEAERSQLGQDMIRQAVQPRIDVVQDPEGRLYYRVWQPPATGEAAPWPSDGPDGNATLGSSVAALKNSDRPIRVTLEEHVARDKPGWQVEPLPFERPDRMRHHPQSRAKLRVTVGGETDEFWLAMASEPSLPDERRAVTSDKRQVSLGLARDTLDLGFEVFLHEFHRKLDPGASAVSHYSSLVDLRAADDPTNRLAEDVLISLNAPISFTDPVSGQSYRLYQSSFAGPLRPGDAAFDEHTDGTARDRLFQSTLSVNSDPGRGLKYLGCLVACVGILVTFYQRRPGAS